MMIENELMRPRRTFITMTASRFNLRFLLCVLALVALTASQSIAASPLTAVAFTPDGKHVALGSQRGIDLRTWPEMVAAGTVKTQLVQIHDLRFSPDGSTLLAAGGSPAEEGAVEVIAWPSQEAIHRVALHEDVVYRVAWSPDGSKWATASGDGTCNVVDARSGKSIARYAGHSRSVLALGFSYDGRSIVSVGIDQTLRSWDSTSGTHQRTLDNHVGTVNAIAVRPASSNATDPLEQPESLPMTVATISEDRTVRIWQPSIGRLMRFVKLASVPRALVWTKSGDRLYVGCNDGQVHAIDPDSMESIDRFDGLDGRIHEVALDDSEQRLLVAGESGFRIHLLKPRQTPEAP